MLFPRSHAPAFIFSAVLVANVSLAPAQELSVVSRSLKGERLNDIGVWNLGSGKAYEVFVTSVAGKAACYRADTLEPLWEREVATDALTAPVIGNLMGNGSPVLAFGSASGNIYFLWPGTGELISSLKTEMSFALPPSIAVFNSSDAIVLGDEQGRIAVASLDPESGQAKLVHSVENTLPGTTAFSVVGSFTQPPTCGDIDNDGNPEIITASDSGVLQVVSFPGDLPTAGQTISPKRYHTRLAQQSRATTLIALGNLSADQSQLIALGVDASIHLFSWDPSQPSDKAIQAAMQAPAYGASLGHLLIGPVNADDAPDLISTANNTIAARYLGRDLNGRQVFLDIAQRHLTTSAPPFSPAVSFKTANGNDAIISTDREGTIWEWIPTSPDNTMTRHNEGAVPTGFTPAGDLKGDGKLSMVVWNEKSFQLSVVSLPVDLPSGTAPVLTAGGNYSRDGQRGTQWSMRWDNLMAGAAERLTQTKAALKQTPDDSELPTDPSSIIAGLDPDDPIAEHIREKHSQTTLGGVALLGSLIVLIMVGAGFVIWKLRRR